MSRGRVVLVAALAVLSLPVRLAAAGWVSGFALTPDPAETVAAAWVDAVPWGSGAVLAAAESHLAFGMPRQSLLLEVDDDGGIVRVVRPAGTELTAVRVLPNGTWIAAGLEARQGSGRPVRVMAIDAAGAVRWAMALDGTSTDTPPALELAANGNILLACMGTAPGAIPVLRILEIAPDGGLVTEHQVPSSAVQRASIAAFGDGGLAVGARDAGQPAVVRFDAAGQIAWQRRASLDCSDVKRLAALPDGTLDVACIVPAIVRLAPDGSVAWQWKVPGEYQMIDVAMASGGDSLVTTLLAGAMPGPLTPWIGRLRSDGSGLEWQRTATSAGWDPPIAAPMADGGSLSAWDRPHASGIIWPASLVAHLDIAGDAPGPCSYFEPATEVLLPGITTWEDATLTVATVPPVTSPLVVVMAPVDVEAQPACRSLGCEVDAGEPDEDCGATTQELLDGVATARNFCDDGDDWFLVKACAGVPLVIATSALEPGADTVVELWTTDCTTMLASDDNGGGGLASRLVHLPGSTTAYAVRVRQATAVAGPGTGYVVTREADGCVQPSYLTYGVDDGRRAGAVGEASADRLLVAGGLTGAGIIELSAAGAVATRVHEPPPGYDSVASKGLGVGPGDEVTLVETIGRSTPGGTVTAPWIVRLDAAGAIAWSERLDEGWTVASVLGWSDGAVAIIVASPTARAVVRLDADGSVAWQRELPTGWYRQMACTLPDGGFAVGGAPFGEPQRVLRIDPAGSLAWSREIAEGRTLTSLAGTRSGRVVAAIDDGGLDGGFVAFEPDGALAWSGSPSIWNIDTPVIGPLADGTIGFVSNNSSKIGAFSEDGRMAWFRHRELEDDGEDQLPLARQPGFLGTADSGFSRLDSLGDAEDACGNDALLRTRMLPAMTTVTDPGVLLAAASLTAVAMPPVALASSPAPWYEECGGSSCAPLDGLVVGPAQGCASAPISFDAIQLGGRGEADPVDFDFDYDGIAFEDQGSGTHVFATPGSYRVAVRFTDNCTPPQVSLRETSIEIVSCIAVREVSGAGAPPLRVRKVAAEVELRFERVPEAEAVHVLGSNLGAWAPGSIIECDAPSVDAGDGTATITLAIPGSSWLVVTGANQVAEGPAGADSSGVERSTRPGWSGCGPAP